MGNQILVIFGPIFKNILFMLLLGILAVLQTILFPGIIFFYLFKFKQTSLIQKWIYVFALSLFSNYALVTILTLLEIYTAPVIYLLIILEVIILGYLFIEKKISVDLNISFRKKINHYIHYIKSLPLNGKIVFITASIVLLFYCSLFFSNLGTVFYFVDTVNNIHWNTWAMDFANNILPRHSSHFPQLIPANWSISYMLIGEPNIHFFPKSIMPLFFLGNLLMFLDLVLTKRQYVFLIALIIYGLFGPIVYSLAFIADGNGDLPVSFFAFLSFYAYLKSSKEKFIFKEYIIVFLFASTAAGTKLAGFYTFFFISFLCLYYLIKNWKTLKKSDVFLLIVSIVFILSVNLFWYFLKPEVMVGGLDQPEWLAKGYSNIIKNSLHLLYYNIGLPVLVFFILTLIFSLSVKQSRFITLIFVIPPIILWMFKYSSDFRNLSFVVPFISYAAGFGFEKIYKILGRTNKDLIIDSYRTTNELTKKRINKIVIPITLVSFILFLSINTDYVYKILFEIYSAINKYFFQSNRIVYFVDYTIFLHVDYYQTVISIMFLLISFAGLLYVLSIKLRELLFMLVFAAIFLNFTFITKSEILQHQKSEFAKVDSRNYYQTISTILSPRRPEENIYTNFEVICSERIPRDIKFYFVKNDTLLNILKRPSELKTKIIFIKLKGMNKIWIDDINNTLSKEGYEILFDDGDFILASFKLTN